LTGEERQDTRRAISQRKRNLIERVFGWSKTQKIRSERTTTPESRIFQADCLA
jgi:hypothetical protein